MFRKLQSFSFINKILGMNQIFLIFLAKFVSKQHRLQALNLVIPSIERFEPQNGVPNSATQKNPLQSYHLIFGMLENLVNLQQMSMSFDGSGLRNSDIEYLSEVLQSKTQL